MQPASREERRRTTWFVVVLGAIAALQALALAGVRWDFMSASFSFALMLVPAPLFLGWVYWGVGWIRQARTPTEQAAVADAATTWSVRWGSLLLPAFFFVRFSWRETEAFRNGGGSLAGVVFAILFAAAATFVMWLIMRRTMTYWAERAALHRRQHDPPP